MGLFKSLKMDKAKNNNAIRYAQLMQAYQHLEPTLEEMYEQDSSKSSEGYRLFKVCESLLKESEQIFTQLIK